MEFNANDDDVNMGMGEDAMLDPQIAAQLGLHQGGQQQPNFNGFFAPNPPPQQGAMNVEDYAALMGIKLDMPGDELGAMPASNLPDPNKAQQNANYFDNYYRSRELGGNDTDATSMTLPAGLGSGASSGMFMGQSLPSSNVYDRSSELAFNDMNRMYDPSSGFHGTPMHAPPPVQENVQQSIGRGSMGGVDKMQTNLMADLGSQTLSPELLSAMFKNNPERMSNFENMNEEEKAAMLKEEQSRLRNRNHSRKSRARKKEYVEGLKTENEELQIYHHLCEQSPDLMALVSPDPPVPFLFASSAYTRVLGYQSHQLMAGQTSFLDLVHPDEKNDVRNVFQKFNTLGESCRFKFRIKSADGDFFSAETSARLTDKGVLLSTRVDRNL